MNTWEHTLEAITLEQVRASSKARDAWFTVLLVDPIAMRLVRWAARHPWITPNRLTAMAFTLGCLAAACFTRATHGWLLAGAGLYYLSFVIDCMDGKLARLMGTGSVFGVWLDFIFDRLLVVICTVALMGGQYAHTDNVAYIVLGGVVIFLNLFRYVNGQTMAQAREQMRRQLQELNEKVEPAAAPADASPPARSTRSASSPRARARSWAACSPCATSSPATACAANWSAPSSSRWRCSSSAPPSTRSWRSPSSSAVSCSSSSWR
ncbi:CDP-alcohol phosphatidyltransferase family protein [Luedemannella flava]